MVEFSHGDSITRVKKIKQCDTRPPCPVLNGHKRRVISGLFFCTVNMGKRVCRHCPIPGCGSKFLVPLADHLTRVHELSGIERKYWLQFAKLQNTNVVRVYEKEAGPKTIFSINQRFTEHRF